MRTVWGRDLSRSPSSRRIKSGRARGQWAWDAQGMHLRVPISEFRALPLDAHQVLADVPLRDVIAIDLPGGGEGRTIADVRALLKARSRSLGGAVSDGLFALRMWIGRLFG